MTDKSQTAADISRKGARLDGFEGDSDLVRRTVKTSLVLVVACVLFVGSLSAAAVFVTSRVFASQPSADARPSPVDPAAKKPLSI